MPPKKAKAPKRTIDDVNRDYQPKEDAWNQRKALLERDIAAAEQRDRQLTEKGRQLRRERYDLQLRFENERDSATERINSAEDQFQELVEEHQNLTYAAEALHHDVADTTAVANRFMEHASEDRATVRRCERNTQLKAEGHFDDEIARLLKQVASEEARIKELARVEEELKLMGGKKFVTAPPCIAAADTSFGVSLLLGETPDELPFDLHDGAGAAGFASTRSFRSARHRAAALTDALCDSFGFHLANGLFSCLSTRPTNPAEATPTEGPTTTSKRITDVLRGVTATSWSALTRTHRLVHAVVVHCPAKIVKTITSDSSKRPSIVLEFPAVDGGETARVPLEELVSLTVDCGALPNTLIIVDAWEESTDGRPADSAADESDSSGAAFCLMHSPLFDAADGPGPLLFEYSRSGAESLRADEQWAPSAQQPRGLMMAATAAVLEEIAFASLEKTNASTATRPPSTSVDGAASQSYARMSRSYSVGLQRSLSAISINTGSSAEQFPVPTELSILDLRAMVAARLANRIPGKPHVLRHIESGTMAGGTPFAPLFARHAATRNGAGVLPRGRALDTLNGCRAPLGHPILEDTSLWHDHPWTPSPLALISRARAKLPSSNPKLHVEVVPLVALPRVPKVYGRDQVPPTITDILGGQDLIEFVAEKLQSRVAAALVAAHTAELERLKTHLIVTDRLPAHGRAPLAAGSYGSRKPKKVWEVKVATDAVPYWVQYAAEATVEMTLDGAAEDAAALPSLHTDGGRAVLDAVRGEMASRLQEALTAEGSPLHSVEPKTLQAGLRLAPSGRATAALSLHVAKDLRPNELLTVHEAIFSALGVSDWLRVKVPATGDSTSEIAVIVRLRSLFCRLPKLPMTIGCDPADGTPFGTREAVLLQIGRGALRLAVMTGGAPELGHKAEPIIRIRDATGFSLAPARSNTEKALAPPARAARLNDAAAEDLHAALEAGEKGTVALVLLQRLPSPAAAGRTLPAWGQECGHLDAMIAAHRPGWTVVPFTAYVNAGCPVSRPTFGSTRPCRTLPVAIWDAVESLQQSHGSPGDLAIFAVPFGMDSYVARGALEAETLDSAGVTAAVQKAMDLWIPEELPTPQQQVPEEETKPEGDEQAEDAAPAASPVAEAEGEGEPSNENRPDGKPEEGSSAPNESAADDKEAKESKPAEEDTKPKRPATADRPPSEPVACMND